MASEDRRIPGRLVGQLAYMVATKKDPVPNQAEGEGPHLSWFLDPHMHTMIHIQPSLCICPPPTHMRTHSYTVIANLVVSLPTSGIN